MKTIILNYPSEELASAVGNLIRKTVLLVPSRFQIIGFNLNDLKLFENIPNTTDMISDFRDKLCELKYRVKSKLEDTLGDNDPRIVAYPSLENPVIIAITMVADTDRLTSKVFSEWLDIDEDAALCSAIEKTKFNLTIYLAEVKSNNSDEQSREILFEHGVDTDSVLAMPAKNYIPMKFFYSIEPAGRNSELTISYECRYAEDEAELRNSITGVLSPIISEFGGK